MKKKGLSQSIFGIRLLDIKLFTLAARYKNLTQASKKIHLSQSAASASVKKLEFALGYNLCCHKRKEFQLTKEGVSLLPTLEQWLRDFEYLVSNIENLPLRIVTTHALASAASEVALEIPELELRLQRPDLAYSSVLADKADIGIVLDNGSWSGLDSCEIYSGGFQLYSSVPHTVSPPILLPEDQLEVLAFQRSWLKLYKEPVQVKARIPSWSIIANICSRSREVGFLPDFLAKKFSLYPVRLQPSPESFKVLAIYKKDILSNHPCANKLLLSLKKIFQY